MSKLKPSLVSGTRDFGPEQVARRKHIIDTIREVYELYGFQPIETPSIEKLSTLMGKYGEEGDKLLYKILNSGDFLAKANTEALDQRDAKAALSSIAGKGLRYDLTVPFARYVVMNQNNIAFPFKRYQIQPVWRADRPQKGRYREFYQCDADVIGSKSLMYEAELIQIIDEVFKRLNVSVTIRINSRKVLEGIADVCGLSEQFTQLTVAIDKLDKVGTDGVKKELIAHGISEQSIEQVLQIVNIEGDSHSVVDQLSEALKDSEVGRAGVHELQSVLQYLSVSDLKNNLKIDPQLARGLGYYTGVVLEVTADDVKMGSISGGGRYDDLTGIFGLPNMSGVGFSFGLDRIYDVMSELQLFEEMELAGIKVLLINFDEESEAYSFKQLIKIRKAGIAAELYPEPAKMKKQMKYADARKIPFVIMAGSNEIESGLLVLKNMANGEQESLSIEAIIEKIA